MSNTTVSTDCFNIMPGLVIDYVGHPAVVISVNRVMETEVVHFTLDTPNGHVSLSRSWARGERVTIIGLCPNLEIDSIDLFKN